MNEQSPDIISSNATKKNYVIGINNGVFVEVNKSLINPNLVLAAFVYGKTGSAFLVGLLTAFNFVGAFLPQLFVSSMTEHRKKKKPFIIQTISKRAVIMLVLIFLVWFSSDKDDLWIIYLFTITFFIYRLFRGSEFIVFWDFFGGALPSNRLGGFIAYRALFSGIAAMLSGVLIVQPVLNSFPENRSYLILFCAAFFILILDIIQLSLVKEVPNKNPPPKRDLLKTISGSAEYFRESSNYRKLIIMRVFHRINMLTFAFLIPYAFERIGIIGMAGIFLTVIESSKFMSSVLWGNISNRYGNRIVLAAGNLCFFISSILVLSSSFVPDMFYFNIPWINFSFDFPLIIFFISLFFAGAAQSGNTVSFKAFVIESAPENRRSSSLAFINTITVPMAFLAPLIGLSVEKDPSRYNWFYVLLAVSGIFTSFFAYKLHEVRKPAGKKENEL